MLAKVKSWLTGSAEASTVRSVNPKSLSTVTVPRISARLPKKPIRTASWPAWPWMSSGPSAAVASTNVVSSPKPVFRS